MRRALVLLALVAVFAFVGCGSDDGSTGATPEPPANNGVDAAAPEPEPAYDQGCSVLYPERVQVEPAEQGALARFCTNADGTRMLMRNTSKKVLEVWAQGSTPVTLDLSRPAPDDFASAEALSAVPGGCDDQVARCVVPADASLSAASEAVVRLRFQVRPLDTLQANAARGVAGWLASKFTPRQLAWRDRIRACANNARELFTAQSPYIEDSLRSALVTSGSCRSLVADGLREAGQGKEVARPQVVDDVLLVTRKLAGGTFDDELVAELIRVIPRR